jgi:hypothetical protein
MEVKICVKNIRKIHVGSETGSGESGYESETNVKVGRIRIRIRIRIRKKSFRIHNTAFKDPILNLLLFNG